MNISIRGRETIHSDFGSQSDGRILFLNLSDISALVIAYIINFVGFSDRGL